MVPRKYGWKPDVPDFRDLPYSVPHSDMVKLPSLVDMRIEMPPVYDQGELGSCESNAVAGCIEHQEMKQNKDRPTTPSRLFHYYNVRMMEGTINVDSGASIRDGIKTLHELGYCEEMLWPYRIMNFKTRPPKIAYQDAKRCRVDSYARVPQTEYALRQALANGRPVIFGFAVYTHFESLEMAKNPRLKLPGPDEKMLGGHAVLLCGYNDELKCFLVRNSWGKNWGADGYFFMDYEYVLSNNLADDFWVISFVPQVDD